MVTISDSTDAKMGRSMKKREIKTGSRDRTTKAQSNREESTKRPEGPQQTAEALARSFALSSFCFLVSAL
jgi:hypothetical protein